MKLTAKQVLQIDDFLRCNYAMVYDEVRAEVVDHIACEIEAKLVEDTVTFSEAFKIVFSKWHRDLKASEWVGFTKIPRFIAKPLIKKDLLFQLIAILLLAAFMFVWSRFQFSFLGGVEIMLVLVLGALSSNVILVQSGTAVNYAAAYYKQQIKYLNILNGCVGLVIGVTLWGMHSIVLNEYYPMMALTYCCLLLLSYNGYFCYRLSKEQQRTITDLIK